MKKVFKYRLTNRQREKRGWNRANRRNHARKEKSGRGISDRRGKRGRKETRTRALYKTGVFTTERFNCPWTLAVSAAVLRRRECCGVYSRAKAQFAFLPRLAQRDEMRNRFIIRHDRALAFVTIQRTKRKRKTETERKRGRVRENREGEIEIGRCFIMFQAQRNP